MANAAFPGMFLDYRDGGLVTTPTTPNTDRLLIMGPALDGPVSTPIAITSEAQAREIFGDCTWSNKYPDPAAGTVPTASNTHGQGIWNGNELVRAVGEAIAAGCNNLLCVRIGGTYASTKTWNATNSGIPVGMPSSGYLLSLAGTGLSFYAQSTSPSFRYNGISLTATVSGSDITISGVPNLIAANQTITKTIQGAASMTVAKFLNAINSYLVDYGVAIIANYSDATQMLLPMGSGCVGTTRVLAGGSYGTRVAETGANGVVSIVNTQQTIADSLFHPITGACASVAEAPFDYATVVGLYADEPITGYAQNYKKDPMTGGYLADDIVTGNYMTAARPFARFIADVSSTYPCHGVMGCKPVIIRDSSTMRQYINDVYLNTASQSSGTVPTGTFSGSVALGYQLQDGIIYTDANNNKIDIGGKISLVAGNAVWCNNTELGDYVTNGAVGYAATPTAMMPQLGLIFKPIGCVKSVVGLEVPADLAYFMSQGIGSQAKAASNTTTTYSASSKSLGSAYVLIKNMPQYNALKPVVLSDVTLGLRNSDYETLNTVRIVNAAVKGVQQASVSFIGQPNSQSVQAALATAIRSKLNVLTEIGALLGGEGYGYDFTISQAGSTMKAGELSIQLHLIPALQIRRITVTVRVSQ